MHRPTFHAAVAGGSTSFGGFKSGHTSVKDQNGFTKLKFRQQGQASEAEMRSSNLRMELQRREAALDSEKKMALAMVEKEEKTVDLPLLLTESAPAEVEVASYDDQDADFGDSDDSDEDSSDDDDDDDDEEELQRELEKIKAERQAAALRREDEERQLAESTARESALHGNPLVQGLEGLGGQAKIKRKWNDDVVFRNQAQSEPEVKKRFVNDTIRNDFHRNFLRKYVA